ncbi:MAG: kelch repeat-containing protein, partial [Methanoregula sp.]|nr:kelch repeat-containing protein [Methanoregula sp.]
MNHLPAVRYCLFIALLLLVCVAGASGATQPVASFKADNTSNNLTEPVTFTDLSTNSPTGWTWYFGDETYNGNWRRATQNALSEGRCWTGSVALPNGSILVMGGINRGTLFNDVWQSTDDGATWTEINASAGWSKRYSPSCVVLPDGDIVLMGGEEYVARRYRDTNDTWRSTDNGVTWTLMNANANWSARYFHRSVALPDGSIVLMGGINKGGTSFNDTWRSTDKGATWTQVNPSSGWSVRHLFSSVAAADGSIVLTGGEEDIGRRTRDTNDTWRSTDKGYTWTEMNASSGWPARQSHTSVATADGSILLMGGVSTSNYNDMWRSTDNGATWTEMNAIRQFSARADHSSVALPDGNILVIGGYGTNYLNDVWQFNPAGSAAQNPAYTYDAPGSYTVTLTAYNTAGFSSIQKSKYITVAPAFTSVPVITSVTPISGCRNMTVPFIITGSSFLKGSTTVEFRNQTYGVIKTTITNVSATRIDGTLDIPANASTGSWNVRVMIANGGENVKTNVLTIQDLAKPTITKVEPATPWYRNSSVKFLITGKDFEPGKTTVTFSYPTNGTP